MPDLILLNPTEPVVHPPTEILAAGAIALAQAPPAGARIVVYQNTGVWSTTATITNSMSGTYLVLAQGGGGSVSTRTSSGTASTSTVWQTISATSSTSCYFSTDGLNWSVPPGFHCPSTPRRPKRGPLIKKSIRSSIKRALSLMANFGMEEDVRVFLGGNEIEVSHPDSIFKFVISKEYHSLIRKTEYPGYSTPYQLSLYTKTNVHVADLCVYMDKTPMLDQILALSMFIKTGNEDKLLEKANFRSLCSSIEFRKQLALGNPVLQKKLRVDAVEIH